MAENGNGSSQTATLDVEALFSVVFQSCVGFFPYLNFKFLLEK